MDFSEHLEKTRRPDGSFDLAAAAESRADEIVAELAEDEESLRGMARKAANSERRNWESKNRDSLKKVFGQDTLPELDLEAKIPMGEDVVLELGKMRQPQVQIRKDLRTQVHLDENEAYATEMRFWYRIESVLRKGGTIADAILRELDSDDPSVG